MPAKRQRRSMADFLREQQAIEDPLSGDPRPGLAGVPAGAEPAWSRAAVVTAAVIPEPGHSPEGHGPLSADERDHLAVCEAALDNLRRAFIVAGKALQVIRDSRLYRGGYATFEDYVEQRWDIGRQHAYRLIAAWRLAERLSPIGDTLTESQVRELLPLAGRHGQDAAATVYQAVAGTDGVRVTAAVLRDVVGILSSEYFNADEAVRQIRAYLGGERIPSALAPADPVQAFTTEAGKLIRNLHRVAAGLSAARTANPDAVRQAIAGIRAVLDEIEREATA
jgi:hypothetical protein